MRTLLVLIVLAIFAGGYSAAAHAYAADACNPPSIEQAQQDCQDTAKNMQEKCVDCAHCCAAHAASLLTGFAMLPPSLRDVLSPLPVRVVVDSQPMSLLRPPKSLV